MNVEGFEKRTLYNAAKSYSIQLEKGDRYDLFNPIIAVTITDFIMFDGIEKVMIYFKLLEKELIFVELPKFTKDEDEIESRLIKWKIYRSFERRDFEIKEDAKMTLIFSR